MQVILLWRKTGFDRIRTANTEILNIPPTGAVQHIVEAMERFDIRNKLYPFFTRDLRFGQSL